MILALAVLLVALLLFCEKIKYVTFSMGLSSCEGRFFLFLPLHYIVSSHVSNANKSLLKALSFLDHFSLMTTQTIQLLYTRLTLPEIWVKMADTRAHSVINGGEIV